MFIDKTLYTTKPENVRQAKEMAVYDLLYELGIPYERLDHDATASISECENIDVLLGIKICKNLFLCNSQKNSFYLLMMPGEKAFKTKELSHQIGTARLSFAPPEFMEEYLDITPGSVSIMGLMNDKDNKVKLLIDEEVLASEYLGCHPCVNTSSLKIRTSDILEKFLPYTKHYYTVVKL